MLVRGALMLILLVMFCADLTGEFFFHACIQTIVLRPGRSNPSGVRQSSNCPEISRRNIIWDSSAVHVLKIDGKGMHVVVFVFLTTLVRNLESESHKGCECPDVCCV